MTSENNNEHGGEQTVPLGLDPDSYTMQRLHHSSPEHLHLTTRTCFIGPIPDGWLKSHRKQWYTHHLHINYHFKAATFSGGHAVSRIRQLSGLEGPSASAMYSSSFPQPDDVDEEDEDDSDGQEEATDEDPPAIPVPRSSEIPGTSTSDGDANAADGGASFSAGKDSLAGRGSSTSKTDSSFHTASETLGGGDGQSDSVPRAKGRRQDSDTRPDQNSTATDARLGAVPEEPERRSDSVVSDSSALGQVSTVTSRASLLPHRDQGNEGGSRTATDSERAQSSKSRGAAPGPGTSGRDAADVDEATAQPISTTKSHPAAAGLVRFNLPDETAEHERRTKIRLAQISRRRSLRRARGSRHDGEIIKMEKMLVKVETSIQDLPETYDENESMSVDTKPVKKWQEYVLVCREVSGEEADFVLQLYQTRVIPADPKKNLRMRSAHDILLSRKTAKVNLFSSLDKTVVVWVPSKRGTMIYILRPRSLTSSVEWYTFLRHVLGWNRPRELQVNVPDLSLTLYLENPFQQLEAQRSAAQASDTIDDAAILKTMREEQAVAGNIIKRCMEMLEGNPEWTQLLQNWSSTKKMGLAWKRYDRLEWVHGAHEQKMYGTVGMQRSHDLELRPKQHYPTTVTLSSRRLKDSSTDTAGSNSQHGTSSDGPQGSNATAPSKDPLTMTEPSAVEGFLIRLTSQRGRDRQMGRMFYKRLYFSTHDQYLCFSTPANAIPPPPPRLPMTEDSTIPTPQQIREKMPLIYAVAPFRLEDGQIAWLRNGNSATRKAHDQDAFDEAERRVNTLLRADGFVDLCKVVIVRSVVRGSVPADRNVEQSDAVDFNENVSNTEQEDGDVDSFDDSRTFELVLVNGLIVRLEAYNAATKREWIARLKALVKYWKLRKTADLELLNSVRQANLAQLHIDEQSESYVGQFAKKWEVSQALASAELFHMCGISCCRTVAMSGLLYWKPRRRSTFRRCSVILCHGQLLLFQASLRNRTGAEIAYSHLGRLSAIDLKDCYIYSGLITEGDLLYQNQAAGSSSFSFVDAAHPGRHVLPRLYLEEGVTGGIPAGGASRRDSDSKQATAAGPWMSSSDDDTMTCFVIWRALRKSYFKIDDTTVDQGVNVGPGGAGGGGGGGGNGNAPAESGRKRKHIRQVTALGVPGRSIVFKTRSRSERDRWVMSIATEIERLGAGEEIRVVS